MEKYLIRNRELNLSDEEMVRLLRLASIDKPNIPDDMFTDDALNSLPSFSFGDPSAYNAKLTMQAIMNFCSNKSNITDNKSLFMHTWISLIISAPNLSGEGQLIVPLPGIPTKKFEPITQYPFAMEAVPEDKEVKTRVSVGRQNNRVEEITICPGKLYSAINIDANIHDLQKLFLVICMNLLRVYNKTIEPVMVHVTGKVYAYMSQFIDIALPKTYGIEFERDVVLAIRECFQDYKDEYIQVVAMLLRAFKLGALQNNTSATALFNYTIKTPLQYVGLHIWKYFDEVIVKSSDIIKLKEWLDEINNFEISDPLSRVLDLKAKHDLMISNPEAGKTAIFFPYSRLINPRFHGALAIKHNQLFGVFLIGMMQRYRQDEAIKVYELQNLAEDEKTNYLEFGKRARQMLSDSLT